jgi:hypothetical protein
MSEQERRGKDSPRSVDEVRELIGQIQDLIAPINPAMSMRAKGVVRFPSLGMTLTYDTGVAACNGCTGCGGCEGCEGCDNTTTVSQFFTSPTVNVPRFNEALRSRDVD